MGDEANWQDHPDHPFCLKNCLEKSPWMWDVGDEGSCVEKRGETQGCCDSVGYQGTDLLQVPPWPMKDAWRKSGFKAGLICLVHAGGILVPEGDDRDQGWS